MVITVKFIGALRHVTGTSEFAFDCKGNVSIKELINILTKKLPALTRSLIDPQLEDPRPNVLILVNGREISILNGLDTTIQDENEVVLIPIVHGG
jgi:MoaD family protein